MSWRATALAAATLLTGPTLARADGPSPAPAVDPGDLPPLPPASEAQSNDATVLAAANANEDVVVGAAKREQSLGNVASAVTVVSADRIRRFGYRTVGEAVAGVAGVYLEDNRLSYSLGIRGLQIPGDFNTRILVLIDGATVNEAWGAFSGVGFESLVGIDDIARIEVIRGPVSSVYGSNAFFGIINIVTKGATDQPAAWGRVAVNSVNGTIESAGFAQGDVHEQIRGSFQLMNRFGDTTTVPDVAGDSTLSSDGSHAYTASLAGTYGGSFAQVRAYRYARIDPFAPYDSNPAGPPYEQYDTQLLVEGGHTWEVTKQLQVVARLYSNLYHFNDKATDFSGSPELDTEGDARTFGGEVRGRYEVNRALGITAGTEASYNRTTSTAYTVGDDPANTILIPLNFNLEGVYTELDGQPTRWLGYTGGVRYDRHSVLDDRVSPRGALFLSEPDKYGLKLLYAQGFRNPSAFEGFFKDNSDFTDNPNIHSERITSYEGVVWAKPQPGLSVRVSGYYWDARGIVEQEPIDVDGQTLLQFQNITRYVTEGVEAEGSYRDARGWYGFAGATYARVGTADSGTLEFGSVPNAPAISAAGGISTPKLWGYAHVSTEAVFLGQRPTRDPDITSPAWFGWNAAVYVPRLAGFDVTAGVRNILGTRDLMPAPGDYDRTIPNTVLIARVPGEGREVYVKVGYAY